MKKFIRCFVVCLCFIGFLVSGALPATAADSVFDDEWTPPHDIFDELYPPTDLVSLLQHVYTRDGAYGEADSYYLGEYFFADPIGFIRTVAQQDTDILERVIKYFPGAMANDDYPDSMQLFPDLVYSIVLTEEDSDAARYLLQGFKDQIQIYWGISKTGDPAIIMAAGLALSSLGGTVLLTKRKRM